MSGTRHPAPPDAALTAPPRIAHCSGMDGPAEPLGLREARLSTWRTVDDLSPEQLDELRRDLEDLVQTLQALIDDSAEAARPVELDQPAMGRVSRIDAIQQQQMLEANRHAQRARIQLIRGALQRFDDDGYGECVTCGECIGFPRLKISPEAPFCIDCQSVREQR